MHVARNPPKSMDHLSITRKPQPSSQKPPQSVHRGTSKEMLFQRMCPLCQKKKDRKLLAIAKSEIPRRISECRDKHDRRETSV